MFDPTPHYKMNLARRVYENNKDPKKHAIHVVTGIGRINFADLAKPRKGMKPTDKEKFGSMILLPDMAYNAEVGKAVDDVATKAFGNDWRTKNATLPEGKRVKVPLKKQSELETEYEGKGDAERAQYDAVGVYFRASSIYQPVVTNARGLPMDEASVLAIKSGDFASFEVAFYPYFPQDGQPNRGVSARLIGVQWIAQGLPFAAKRASNFTAIDIPAHVAAGATTSGTSKFVDDEIPF